MTAPRDLLIVGSGGLGREAVAAVRAINSVQPTFTLRGYLDDNPERAGTEVDGLEVLGPIERGRVDDFPDAQVVVCAGVPTHGSTVPASWPGWRCLRTGTRLWCIRRRCCRKGRWWGPGA